MSLVSSIRTIDLARASADFAGLNARFPFITMIAQWDFLDFLTTEASRYPNFTLRMHTSFVDVLRDDARVCGIRYRDDHGEGDIRASLVVGAESPDMNPTPRKG